MFNLQCKLICSVSSIAQMVGWVDAGSSRQQSGGSGGGHFCISPSCWVESMVEGAIVAGLIPTTSIGASSEWDLKGIGSALESEGTGSGSCTYTILHTDSADHFKHAQ